MSPTLLAKIRSWTLRRQGLLPHSLGLSDLLEQIIGVYSAHPSGTLSLWARLPGFTYPDLQTLEAQKAIVRVPAMRGSIHILPRPTAHQVVGAVLTAADDPAWAERYSEEGRKIPIAHYPAWSTALFEACKTPQSVKELKSQDVIPADKLKFVLNRLGYERLMLRIGARSPRSNLISYVATNAWLGHAWGPENRTENQAWLAQRYWQAFGPARLEDFRWWAGITKAEAQAAMAGLDLVPLEADLLLLAEDVEAFEASSEPAEWPVILLPQWDAYSMGYAPDGRDRILPQADVKRLYGKLGATGGNALGAVLVNGNCAAVWTARLKGSTYQISLDKLRSIETHREAVAAKFLEMAQWLGLKKIDLQG